MHIDLSEIVKATLIFIRIGGMLFFLPILGDSPTPVQVRVLLAGALSAMFFGLVPFSLPATYVLDTVGVGWLIAKEIAIGFSVGFIAKLAFEGILMAASLVGYQMGFGMDNLLIPDANQQMTAFKAMHRIIVMLIFLSLGLHHIFMNGIAESFNAIPLGQSRATSDLGALMIELSAQVFSVAIQLSAPVLIALLFTMAALGLIARTVPQMNVFTMSFPASFFIGLLVYIATFPFFPEWLEQYFNLSHQHILTAVRGFAP